MKIAVFGGTGRVGKVFVQTAVQQGYLLKMLVRDASKIDANLPGVEVIVGDATNFEDVRKTVEGVNAVVSMIGHTKNSPADLQQVLGQYLLEIMRKNGLKRLIILTGNGVFVDGDSPGLVDKVMTKILKILDPDRINDGIKHVAQIIQSDLDWTIVRTPLQTSWPKKDTIVVGMVGTKNMGITISRQNVANFILAELKNPQYIKQAPAIANPLF